MSVHNDIVEGILHTGAASDENYSVFSATARLILESQK